MQQIVIGNIRILLLSEDIVRIEYGKNGVFCDCDTFSFRINRNTRIRMYRILRKKTRSASARTSCISPKTQKVFLACGSTKTAKKSIRTKS